MKVAIFTDTFLQTNGVVTHIKSTMKQLKKLGVDVVVFAPGKEPGMKEYDGIRVYFLKSTPLSFYPEFLLANFSKIITKTQTLLEVERPDVYHVHTPFVMGFLGRYFARRFRKPLVGTFHTLIEEYTAHITGGKFKSIMRDLLGKTFWPYLRMFYNRCHPTIAPGQQLANLLEEHDFKDVQVVPNGVEFSRVRSKKFYDIRKMHGIPKDANIILHLGRISFEKKLELLFEAFKKLRQNDTYLLVVGSGPSLEQYKTLAREMNLKNVTFAGYVDDKYIASYYAAADFFVTPSDTEICPMVVLEAFGAGKPVIGPNYLGTSDLILDNFNGLKFIRNNSSDLKDKMNFMLQNKQIVDAMSKNARKFSDKYSLDKTTKDLIELYKNSRPKTMHALREMLYLRPRLNKVIARLLNNSQPKACYHLKNRNGFCKVCHQG